MAAPATPRLRPQAAAWPLAAWMLAALLVTALGCARGAGSSTSRGASDSAASRPLPDTLRVGTLYSPSAYFIYREEEMGYDYSLVSRFAQDKGMALDLTVATSLPGLLQLLDSGKVDLVAYEVPIIGATRGRMIPCGIQATTSQVLVQPRHPRSGEDTVSPVRDVTDLVGRDVWVERDSKYHHRLMNIDQELGGGIRIHAIEQDTLLAEDLIQGVSEGKIPLTIVDSDIARVNKTYYPDLDVSLEVSFPQRASWGVAPGAQWLADSVDAWMAQEEPRRANADLLRRYFELSRFPPPEAPGEGYKMDFHGGHMSPYDQLFRRHARALGLPDWRLLAAQAFVESRYDPRVVSWAGARGIMQIMPRTARHYGVDPAELTDNDQSIRVGAAIMADLDRSLRAAVPSAAERQKFVLAAYNSGIAHVRDAIALAQKYGRDPQVWDHHVADALLLKANPQYYNDPVCRYGYFRGTETVAYVRRVTSLYDQARHRVKK